MSKTYREVAPSTYLEFEKNKYGRKLVTIILLISVSLVTYDLIRKYIFYTFIIILGISIIISIFVFKLTKVKMSENDMEILHKKGILGKKTISNYINWFTITYITIYLIYSVFIGSV